MSFVLIPGNDVPTGAEEHWLDARGDLHVRMLTAPALGAPRGTCVLASGRTEFIEKYFETVRDLQGRGFCVFSMDWRGQGLSGRELRNSQKCHFSSFDDPVNDLADGVRMLADELPRPHVLLAHSMGGAITLRAMQTRKLDVTGAAFTSPMWGISALTGGVKRFARLMAAIGFSGTYAPGVQRRWKREAFEGNPVTNDEARHQRCQDLISADPRLALAGPTYGWLAAAAAMFEAFREPAALAHLKMPIVVASARQEMLVSNAAHAEIVPLLANCTHISIDEAKHEILMEKDGVRTQFWAAFDAMAEKAAPAGG